MTDLEERVAKAIRAEIDKFESNHDNEGYKCPDLSMARAAIAAVYEWQPIETAPKDMEILTYRKAGFISVACWIGSGWCITDGCRLLEVTHWMPLLLPPPSKPANKA